MGDPRDRNSVFSAQFELGRFRHPIFRPRRVKHEVELELLREPGAQQASSGPNLSTDIGLPEG